MVSKGLGASFPPGDDFQVCWQAIYRVIESDYEALLQKVTTRIEARLGGKKEKEHRQKTQSIHYSD